MKSVGVISKIAMVDYTNVISVGCGIIFLIIVGFISVKFGIIKSSSLAPVNSFLFRPCFTWLIAKNVMYEDLKKLDFKPFGIVALSAIATQLILTFTFLFKNDDKLAFFLSTMLPSTYINYIIIGIPIFDAIWPGQDIQILTVITLCNDIITAPIYMFLGGIYNYICKNKEHVAKGEPKDKFSFKILLTILLNILKSPIIIGYIIGFIWAGIGIPRCVFVDTMITTSSQCILALSCFCVGSFLAEHEIVACPWYQFLICALSRHVLMPIIAGIFSWAFGVSAKQSRQTIIISTLPTAVASYLLSSNTNVGTGPSSTMIFWTNIFFIPAIIVWFVILDKLNLFIE